jgi:hypothetical protein
MPVNPTPVTEWTRTLKIVSVSALAVMAIGAIVLPLAGVIAGIAYTG